MNAETLKKVGVWALLGIGAWVAGNWIIARLGGSGSSEAGA